MLDVTIRKAAREYVTWPVTGVGDADALEVSSDLGETWFNMVRSTGTAKVLVAGPDAVDNPVETMVVDLGHSPLLFRRSSSPEIIIRSTGGIYCF